MSRHKHPLYESFCPKQIFLPNFPKELSLGQSHHTRVFVQLSVLPAALQHTDQSELRLLFESITIPPVSEKLAAAQKETGKETEMHNFIFRHLTRSPAKNCSPIQASGKPLPC